MADTADTATFSSPADEAGRQDGATPSDEAEAPHDERSVRDLLEQLGGDLRDLGVSVAQLEAARNMPDVRRTARDIAGALILVLAALTAFAFLNAAAIDGLSRVMATWLAALALAAVWIAVGGVLFFALIGSARRWLLWIVAKEPPTEAMEDLERQRDAAGEAARTTLEQLGPALATQIALAALPKAEDVAGDVAVGVVEIGDNVLDASDEIVEVVAEQVPGGGLVSQVWTVALAPGRLGIRGIRVATTVLRRNNAED